MTKEISNWHKALLVSLLMIYSWIAYFAVASFTKSTYTHANIFIDDAVPFVPFFIIFYLLGSLLVVAPVFIIKDKREFYMLLLSYLIMSTISFSLFLITPIQMIRPEPAGSDIFSKLVIFQQNLDPPFNTFPSLHVSQDFFAFLIIRRYNKKIGNYIIPLIVLIILSTMFVKQHNFIDVVGGIVVALIAYWFFKKKTSE